MPLDPHDRSPVVVAVASDDAHRFSKVVREEITLVEGWGVDGDAHAGPTVMHRYDRRKEPERPNLRQVHLLHAELLDEVADDGYRVTPGAMGENVTTLGVDLLALPTGTLLELGEDAVVEVTGLRNPCKQIDALGVGLMGRMVSRRADGSLVRKAGVMAVVRRGGVVRAGDEIRVRLPDGEHRPLAPV
ncbi:molybdenum cofactor biosysynthesis protein [Actinotalea ferrariae CF5-4]|uniref:Molybdenum cofactor biosysynthesis protein n=1 Tax=Actinotalea ferrariae CF5-4 TaxID=948458 RepID=A0A021VRH6_9CELL|nr:MOSC domain-containing protein [Actinotalea ferrariae]EYR63723.1 molybdenum cofactor biosysynthesis protein [Actinotalea ferrariae CF5-4]